MPDLPDQSASVTECVFEGRQSCVVVSASSADGTTGVDGDTWFLVSNCLVVADATCKRAFAAARGNTALRDNVILVTGDAPDKANPKNHFTCISGFRSVTVVLPPFRRTPRRLRFELR